MRIRRMVGGIMTDAILMVTAVGIGGLLLALCENMEAVAQVVSVLL